MSVYSGHSVERHIVPYQFEIEKVIDTKLEKLPSHSNVIISNRQIDNYQLILTDVDKIIEMNKDTANDLTIPANNTSKNFQLVYNRNSSIWGRFNDYCSC